MSHRRLPVSLRDKITKYYEHRFQGKLFDEERILAEVSRPLRKVSIIMKARKFPLKNLPVSLLGVLRLGVIVKWGRAKDGEGGWGKGLGDKHRGER